MLFNSLEFLIFFPVVTLLFFLIPHSWRSFHLLVASCIFYMAFIPVYILILFFTIIIDYVAGIMIAKASGRKRKYYLVMSLIANIGVLSIFKYFNFFIDNINTLFHIAHLTTYSLPFLNIILPIGLSFHTFQAMSYTIEVYRGHQQPEKNFVTYALYVMFYPQLVAGPIERPQNIIHQLHEKKRFDYYEATEGLKMMMWGMFKKVVIADRLAKVTSPVFNDAHHYSPTALLLAAFFFSFQIYCDFSGYSDIAIGAARVMGIKLMTNFNKPYRSKNVAEFWRRWHISLSTWFRDYLYISLGGNRVSVPRWYFNLFFVFLVSGFWHGANWTFVVWGALHGFYLIFAIVTQKMRARLNHLTLLDRHPRLLGVLQMITTFCLVLVAWVFFRANTIHDAFYILGRFPVALADIGHWLIRAHFSTESFKSLIGFMPVFVIDIQLSFLLIALLQGIEWVQTHKDLSALIRQRPIYIRWTLYYLMIAVIIFLGVYENRQFIYFQF
ncbi:MBOAT family O-acyltransferase [Puia dinghuensis]|uniref:Alginate O-acetyltransferase n=1 Tax=Puia dinghuensis TaxID=1792502 RepID=A0A8J2UHF1_9BACT|nr:MBOAT family protein [Puia dinghuensis]GGB16546.1 alginate O-acetyltransferase [Puia dinghuensis]